MKVKAVCVMFALAAASLTSNAQDVSPPNQIDQPSAAVPGLRGGQGASLVPAGGLGDIFTSLLTRTLPKPPATPLDVVFIHDAGKDLDDECAALTLATLQHANYVTVKLAVAGVAPALARAQLVRGLFKKAGLDVPSAVGDESGTAEEPRAYQDTTYMAPADEIKPDGVGMLTELIVAAAANNQPLTVVVTSALTELAQAIQRLDDSVARAGIGQVVFMGGIVMSGAEPVLDTNNHVLPEGGPKGVQNVVYDEDAALYAYKWLQTHAIPFTVTTRWSAMAAPITTHTYGAIRDTQVAEGMQSRALQGLVTLWETANSPFGSELRKARKFPLDRCDRAWYVNTFLNGVDPGDADIFTVLLASDVKLNPYDAQAALAILSVPEVFTPVSVGGVSIIGLSKETDGIKDAATAAAVIHDLIVAAI